MDAAPNASTPAATPARADARRGTLRHLANIYRLGVKELWSLARDPIMLVLIIYTHTDLRKDASGRMTCEKRAVAPYVVPVDSADLGAYSRMRIQREREAEPAEAL